MLQSRKHSRPSLNVRAYMLIGAYTKMAGMIGLGHSVVLDGDPDRSHQPFSLITSGCPLGVGASACES